MSDPYFFICPDSIQGNSIVLAGEDFNHLVKVLRAPEKSRVSFSDCKSYRYESELVAVKKDHALLSIVSRHPIKKSLPKVILFQCILKKAAMELCIQKACEIGVDTIIPVISARIVVSPEKVEAKIGRWQKICRQACQQSKRNFFANIMPPVSINEVSGAPYGKFFVPYEQSSNPLVLDLEKKVGESIAVMVGPEGGLEQKEVECLRQKGAEVVGLGQNILRAETAALYMLSVMHYFFKKDNG